MGPEQSWFPQDMGVQEAPAPRHLRPVVSQGPSHQAEGLQCGLIGETHWPEGQAPGVENHCSQVTESPRSARGVHTLSLADWALMLWREVSEKQQCRRTKPGTKGKVDKQFWLCGNVEISHLGARLPVDCVWASRPFTFSVHSLWGQFRTHHLEPCRGGFRPCSPLVGGVSPESPRAVVPGSLRRVAPLGGLVTLDWSLPGCLGVLYLFSAVTRVTLLWVRPVTDWTFAPPQMHTRRPYPVGLCLEMLPLGVLRFNQAPRWT